MSEETSKKAHDAIVCHVRACLRDGIAVREVREDLSRSVVEILYRELTRQLEAASPVEAPHA